MKHSILLAALGLTAFGAAAQEVGNVISSTPVIQQVAVSRQFCNQQPLMMEQQTSGGGGILGAIVGGVVGNQIGHGGGRAVATVIGTTIGAVTGNNIEANGNRQVRMAPQCTTQTSYENRTMAWNVTYEYGGRQHTVQMPYDPGPTIRLQITPVGANDRYAPPVSQGYQQGYQGGPVVVAPGLYAPPQVLIQSAAPVAYQAYPYSYPPAYPVYAPYYRPFPVGISLGFGYVHGHGHRHGHRH